MKNALDVLGPKLYNPWKEFASLQRRMDQLLNEFTGSESATSDSEKIDFLPACDLEESEHLYLLSIEVPGIPKENLNIEVTGNVLTVSGSHEEVKKESKGKKISERLEGRFERSFMLPDMWESSKVEAHYHDGVLKIMVPKAEMTKSRRIPIADKKITVESTSGAPSKKTSDTRAA